jgi:Tfp pilus assembly protein PilN
MKWVLVPAVSIVAAAVLIYLGLVLYQAKADVADLQKQLTASQPPIADQTQKIASLKTEIAQVTPQSAPIEAQTAQVTATAAAFRSRLLSLEGGRIKVDSDLKDRVVGLLPYNKEHLSLTSVNHNGSIIAITGAAADEDYIFQYARKLRESGGITTTVIQSIQAA